MELRDTSGNRVYLADVWTDAPKAVVLSFVRHFGCPLCRAEVAKYRDALADFEAAGAHVVVIGQGTPTDAARFSRRERLPFPLLPDSDGSAFAAYGLEEGTLGQLFGVQAMRRYLTTMVRGFLPGGVVGSTRQLPGTFIIDTSGMVRFAHPATHAGDTPTVKTLLNALHEIVVPHVP